MLQRNYRTKQTARGWVIERQLRSGDWHAFKHYPSDAEAQKEIRSRLNWFELMDKGRKED